MPLTPSEKIRVFQYATNRACAPYRLEGPARALNATGKFLVRTFHSFDRAVFRTLASDADIVVFQRVKMSLAFAKLRNALKQYGKWLVYEIDDDLLHLPPESRFAQKTPANFRQQIQDAIASCDAVQCSTESLAQVLSALHSDVAVFENQLLQTPSGEKQVYAERPAIIAYAAGEDHWLDWLTIKDVFNRTVEQLENNGFSPQVWILGGRNIFDSVQTHNKRYFPLAPHDAYLRIMSQADVSIAPLANNRFNQSKSDVKFLESAAARCAFVASDVVYAKSVQHDRTGLLFHNSEQFAAHLKALVENPTRIVPVVENAHRYVTSERLIEQHIHKRQSAYLRWNEMRSRLAGGRSPAC